MLFVLSDGGVITLSGSGFGVGVGLGSGFGVGVGFGVTSIFVLVSTGFFSVTSALIFSFLNCCVLSPVLVLEVGDVAVGVLLLVVPPVVAL